MTITDIRDAPMATGIEYEAGVIYRMRSGSLMVCTESTPRTTELWDLSAGTLTWDTYEVPTCSACGTVVAPDVPQIGDDDGDC